MAVFSPATLPTGREGRILAIGVLVAAFALAWFAAASPLLDWYAARDQALSGRIEVAQRMAAIAADLPAAERQAEAARQQTAPTQIILPGSSDSIANAALESLIDTMARQADANLVSTEALTGVQIGNFRRVGLHVTVRAPWANLLRLLAAVEGAQPRMSVGDVQIQAGPLGGAEQLLDMSFSAMAFRAGTTEATPPPDTTSPSDSTGDQP